MTPAPLVLAALFAAPAPAPADDPDLIGMPGMPDVPAETAPAPAPADEAASPPPPPTGPSETRFGATVSTRLDADLADDGGGEDTVESHLRFDLELATRLSPRTTALVAGRISHEARTPDAAFDDGRAAALAELREARLSWQGDGVGLDVGQLFLRWGVADAVSPNDVLNPQDFLDPAPVSFETPMLPVPAVRLTASPGDFAFELAVVPFFVPHRAALFGSDWAPVGGDAPTAGLLGTLELLIGPEADDDAWALFTAPRPPDESPRNASVGTRVGWHGPGVDLHLNAAHTWDRLPAVRFDPALGDFLAAARANDTGTLLRLYPDVQTRLAGGAPLLDSRYHRLDLIGLDLAWAVGDVLVKAEAAHSFHRTLYRRDFSPLRVPSLSYTVGADWMPDPDVTATLEVFGLRPWEAAEGGYLYVGRHLVQATGHLRWVVIDARLTADVIGQYGLTQEDYTVAPSLALTVTEGHTVAAGVYVMGGPRDTLGGVFDRNDAGWLRWVGAF
ncbi:hypothetical protein L6V77_17030 [Myxococcota bacterium]|nr:hypothetical protein [Myxococcota bacterium]